MCPPRQIQHREGSEQSSVKWPVDPQVKQARPSGGYLIITRLGQGLRYWASFLKSKCT